MYSGILNYVHCTQYYIKHITSSFFKGQGTGSSELKSTVLYIVYVRCFQQINREIQNAGELANCSCCLFSRLQQALHCMAPTPWCKSGINNWFFKF